MRKKISLCIVPALLAFVFLFPQLKAQDTLRVMSYNLLRYGALGVGGCSPTPVTQRNTWFTNILNATQPDIFGVNEIGPYMTAFSPANNISQNILPNVVGKGPFYEATQIQYDGNQDICNMMWFNSSKLGLSTQDLITVNGGYRPLDYYKFYYKGQDPNADSTFVHVILCHLMATNASGRSAQTDAAMDYLDNDVGGAADNYIIMGDLNMDTPNAGAFQNMTTHSNFNIRMRDPLNISSNWSNNNAYDYSWTQSTRTSAYSCGSGGGLDDRFDIILCSNSLLNGTDGIQYIPGSYWVPGNPHSPNPQVSSTVRNNMVGMSDHYPVVMDLEVSRAVALDVPKADFVAWAPSPFTGSPKVMLDLAGGQQGIYTFRLLDVQGREVAEHRAELGTGRHAIALETTELQDGVYFLHIGRSGSVPISLKTVRIH